LEQQESISSQHAVRETIGFLAIEEGSGQWGNLAYEAAQTPIAITDQWTDQSFGQLFATAPAFLSSLATYYGDDNTHVRYNNLSSEGVQIKLEEDTTRDSELAHLAEVVSFLAIGGQGMLLATVPQLDIGEVRQITSLTHTPQVITLQHQYNQPVVFAQSATAVGTDPVSIRIRNIQSNQFEIYLAEPSNRNQLHNTAESVTYLVLETGVHRLSNGTWLEVGTVTTAATVGVNLANPSSESVDFSFDFPAAPVVLSQIQTVAMDGPPYLQTRHLSISPSSVSLALEQEEASTESYVAETVGYLAIEVGSGVWSGMEYETSTTSNVVTHAWYDLTFDNFYVDEPALLTSLATYYGRDNAHLSYGNLTTGGAQVKVTEDTTADTELDHNSAEEVAYFVIGGTGLLTGVPQIPPQVTAFLRDSGGDTYDVLDTIQTTFNEQVTVTADALQLTNDANSGTPVDLTGIGFRNDANSLTATWDFSGLPRLAAAWYTATLDATKVTDASGLMLDGNGNGMARDPYARSFLVAQRGDSDLDGYINITDFNTLAQNFDPRGLDGANDWSRANFDGDGDIDMTDFNTLIKNFSTLGYAPLPSIQASSLTTGAATVTVIDTGEASGLSMHGTLSGTSTSSETGWVDRAFVDWDDTTGNLVISFEFSRRRRLRHVVPSTSIQHLTGNSAISSRSAD